MRVVDKDTSKRHRVELSAGQIYSAGGNLFRMIVDTYSSGLSSVGLDGLFMYRAEDLVGAIDDGTYQFVANNLAEFLTMYDIVED